MPRHPRRFEATSNGFVVMNTEKLDILANRVFEDSVGGAFGMLITIGLSIKNTANTNYLSKDRQLHLTRFNNSIMF